jgi:zinc protease
LVLASGGIQAPYTAEALGEYYKELEAFGTGELRDGELDIAKEAIIRALPSSLETNGAVAGSMTALALNGLPLDYYATLPAKVAKVDAKEVARVAKKYFTVAKMPAVIVGPKELIQEKLTAMKVGEVTLP